ncbi:hypothetical protein DL771_006138 [Monosporascus sp. 5C6A]|nr:hypothetical protein DL771_006138 [Monosporascus sp. 5C6A]
MSSNPTTIGVIPPPAGVTPNFDDPPSRQYIQTITAIVLAITSSIFVGVRFYAVLFILPNRGIADYLLGFAWSVPCWSKLLEKQQLIVIYAATVVNVLYGTLTSFEWLYACQPMEKYWDLTIVEGTCFDLFKMMLINGVMNVVTDAIILLLPVWFLWKLRLPTRQRVGVMGIMMTGGLIVRAKASADLIEVKDLTWQSVPQGALCRNASWGDLRLPSIHQALSSETLSKGSGKLLRARF